MVYLFLWLMAFLPIVVWAYIFSNVDSSPLNRVRFFSWVFAWIISVFPVLYLENIVSNFSFSSLNLFQKFYELDGIFSVFSLSFSIWLFVLFLFIISFIFLIFLFFRDILKVALASLKNVFFLIIFWILISLFSYFIWLFLDFFPSLNFPIYAWLDFFWSTFDTFKLVIFYYIVVWLVEELSKHFTHLKSSFLYIKDIKTWVLYSIFIALWFTFIENILYITSTYESFGLSKEVFSTLFFRSIFSAMVHIFSSAIVWYYFSKAILFFRKKPDNKKYFSTIFVWFFFWVFMHTLYDTLLTLNFSLILFIYLAFWYFYITSIFYKN